MRNEAPVPLAEEDFTGEKSTFACSKFTRKVPETGSLLNSSFPALLESHTRSNPAVHTLPRAPPPFFFQKEDQISFIVSFPRSRGSCASDFVRPSDECGEFCREPSLRC